MSADPNRCRKDTAPSRASWGAPGQADRSDQRFASVPADCAQEGTARSVVLQDGAGDVRIVVEIGAQALG